jgi:hypothetical protein
MKTREARPVGLQRLRDVCANESLKEEDLFLEGSAGLLQRAVGDEAVWCRPHEDAPTSGDVRPIETDGDTVLGLGFPSLLLREAGIYGNANVRDDLEHVP